MCTREGQPGVGPSGAWLRVPRPGARTEFRQEPEKQSSGCISESHGKLRPSHLEDKPQHQVQGLKMQNQNQGIEPRIQNGAKMAFGGRAGHDDQPHCCRPERLLLPLEGQQYLSA